MPVRCIRGCVSNFASNNDNVRKAINHHMLMPWIELWIEGDDGSTISVSNVSSQKAKAVIKSMHLGLSDGTGTRIEIIDEEGGGFYNFFKKISKGNLSPNMDLRLRFGWAYTNCEGGSQTFGETRNCDFNMNFTNDMLKSQTFKLLLMKINVDIKSGMYVFTLSGGAPVPHMINTRPVDIEGTDNNPRRLVNAIKRLCANNVRGLTARFYTLHDDCRFRPFRFRQDGDIDPIYGPLGVWQANNNNVLETCRRWLEPYKTQNNRAIQIAVEGNEVIFFESPATTCVNNNNLRNVGTYIVGGPCSPVLEFNPSIEIPIAVIRGRNTTAMGNNLAAGQEVIDDQSRCFEEQNLDAINDREGVRDIDVTTANDYRIWNRSATEIAANNRIVSRRASLGIGSIRAELKIQGDPSYNFWHGNLTSQLGLVFFNPFRIRNALNQTDWAFTGCNDTFSSKNWRIKGISHDISDGSYVTTLEIYLNGVAGYDAPPEIFTP